MRKSSKPGVSKLFCHISYYTTVREPDILRNVIFRGMLHSTKSTNSFVNKLFFNFSQNVFTDG